MYTLLRLIFILFFTLISIIVYLYFFHIIYSSNSIIVEYGIKPFDICKEQPFIWDLIKLSSIIFYLFNNIIFFSYISKKLIKHTNNKKRNNTQISKTSSKNLDLIIGLDSNNNLVKIPEKSLYQNILITGTIGSGKTSSAMYPFTKQLISYKSNVSNEKLGMLILDVKGNYYSEVYKYAKQFNRLNDLIVIDLSGNIKYNPLHKPKLKSSILANRLKSILLLFSPNNSESFWIDKAEQVLSECIKLCRLYNDGYVTFEEIHNLVVIPNYYEEKINILRNFFTNDKFSKEDSYNLLSSLNFFEKEYKILDERTLAILKSEITRITNIFISDYNIKNVFSPNKEEINFNDFNNVLEDRKNSSSQYEYWRIQKFIQNNCSIFKIRFSIRSY